MVNKLHGEKKGKKLKLKVILYLIFTASSFSEEALMFVSKRRSSNVEAICRQIYPILP
jgi:hypothetical protein